MKSWIVAWVAVLAALLVYAESADPTGSFVLRPARVWTEGELVHTGWVVTVEGNHIVGVGPKESLRVPAGAQVIELPDTTSLPGLMDAHFPSLPPSLQRDFLNDQVLKEPVAYRTLRAGGAGEGNTALRFHEAARPGNRRRGLRRRRTEARDRGRPHSWPRLFVATGRSSPRVPTVRRSRSLRPDICCTPQGAEEEEWFLMSSVRRVSRRVRGADWIKVRKRLSLGAGWEHTAYLQQEEEPWRARGTRLIRPAGLLRFMQRLPRKCAALYWRVSTWSNTVMAAPRKFSNSWRHAAWLICRP